MSAAAPRADFKLILYAVQPAKLQAVVAELMEVFPIDQKTALGAVQNAPIILVSGMTQQMAANLRTHLVRLGRLGAQLRLTAEPVGKLKQFRWPALPPSVLRPGNLFTCPACGERFVVHRWQPSAGGQAPASAAPPEEAPGAEPLTEPVAGEAVPEAAIPEAQPVPPSAGGGDFIPEAEAIEGELPEAEELPEAAPAQAGGDLEELTDFLDAILKDSGKVAAPPAEPPPAPPKPAPAPPPKPVPPQAVPTAAVAEEPKTQSRPAQPPPAAVPVAAVAQEPATQSRVAPAGPPKAKPQAPPKPQPVPPPKAPPRPAPAPAPRTGLAAVPPGAPKPAPEPAGPRYDVSVAKVRGPQQDELARLLVQRMNLPPEEALRQCERTVVMVCKGATAAEAEEWRKALAGIGIKPRIRKH